jgi:protein ImuB
MCSAMVVCVLLPRFALVVAAGGREALAVGPAALAPEAGREQLVGEVNAPAESRGVYPGMRLGEALSRCPALALIPPDPVGVADAWEALMTRLESVGAQVETTAPGMACFEAQGLRRLHGGSLDGVVAAVRRAIAVPARIGAGPSRFCAQAGAARARSRRAELVHGAEELRREPVAMLRAVPETAALVEPLEQLGLGTLGAVAALEQWVLAERFGRPGERAWELARGRDTPLHPREPGEVLQEELELEESASGEQLGRALELLVDRLVARRERGGRTLRVVVLSARLVEGGTWRERMVFREPSADAGRMRLVLAQRLAVLPAPAESLRLSVERFGPPHQAGRALFEDSAAARRGRLREAVKQARAAAGPDAALRVLTVDPDSRVPERRAVLTPFE